MYKITKEKSNINVGKLHQELIDNNIKPLVTHDNVNIYLSFLDIKKIKTDVLDENEEVIDTNITYEKKSIQDKIVTDEESGEETINKVTVWEDYTVEFEQVLSDIDVVVTNHDPTPIPKPKTELEKMQEVIDQLLLDSLGV